MARIGKRVVYVTREDTNEIVRLNPGDTVPSDLEHLVSGRALADADSESAVVVEPAGDREVDAATDGYAALDFKELRDLLKKRELPTGGNKGELIARLTEDDESEDEGPDEDPDDVPDESGKEE